MDISAWVKPFSVFWRARAYFFIGALLWIAQQAVPLPFSGIKEDQREWYQTLAVKAFGSLDKLAFLVLLSGLIYVVLSDCFEFVWLSKIQQEVREGFKKTGDIFTSSLSSFNSGLGKMTYEAVRVWADSGAGTTTELSSTGVLCLKNGFGDHNKAGGNIVDFLIQNVMEKAASEASYTWESLVCFATIRPGTIADHFEWDERRNYRLVCAAGKGVFPFRFTGSFRVLPGELRTALSLMRYRFTFDSVAVFDFQTWWPKAQSEFEKSNSVKLEDAELSYDGLWVKFSVKKDCQICRVATEVSIRELSYVSTEDRCYVVAVRQATKDIQLTLALEGLPAWTVKSPTTSAPLYYDSNANVVAVDDFHKSVGNVKVNGWTLPGIAAVIEWTPN